MKFVVSILILSCFMTIRLFIFKFIPIHGINLSSPFFTDLISTAYTVPYWLVLLSDILNLLLLWLIGQILFGKRIGFLVPLFYAISPWPAYLAVGGSIYILILFGVTLLYSGLLLAKNGKDIWGIILSLSGIGVMVYSSLAMIFVLPFFLWGIYKSGLYANKVKFFYLAAGLILLPLVFLSIFNINSLKMVSIKEVSLFNEVGLINSVNTFRGEIGSAGYPDMGVLVENKITYLGRHVLFNTLTVFSPFTYFTQQFKLLGFSFSPPILLGILIPFLYGLVGMFRSENRNYNLLFLTLPLLAPTIIHSYSPDLNSLILILPLIIFISAWGTAQLVKNKKWLFVAITSALILIQGLTTLYDIKTREPIRYQKTVEIRQ